MTPTFHEFSPITRKIKIVEFFYYFPHSYTFHIFHNFFKVLTTSEWGGGKISSRFYLTKKNCAKVAYFSGKMLIALKIICLFRNFFYVT